MELIIFKKDYTNKKIIIQLTHHTDLEVVWRMFTDVEMIEQWFAPKPYRVETKWFDFRTGGKWLYFMLSPEGEKFWSLAKFKHIEPHKTLTVSDAFCDEYGIVNTEFPQTEWQYEFSEKGRLTTVDIQISFTSEEDVGKYIEMGFEEGYKMSLAQLKEILEL